MRRCVWIFVLLALLIDTELKVMAEVKPIQIENYQQKDFSITDYDRVTYALSKTLRLMAAILLIIGIVVQPHFNIVVWTIVKFLSNRYTQSSRLCIHALRKIFNHYHFPRNNEECMKSKNPHCNTAVELNWDEIDWWICKTDPQEFQTHRTNLLFLQLRHQLRPNIVLVLISVFISLFVDTHAAMQISQTRCTDRHADRIALMPVMMAFTLYSASPRCPNENDVQTGFAQYVDEMKYIQYTCFPGYQLVGERLRKLTLADSNAVSAEGEMPRCISSSKELATQVPEIPAEGTGTEPLKLHSGRAALIIFPMIFVFTLYLYVSNQIMYQVDQREDLDEMKAYEKSKASYELNHPFEELKYQAFWLYIAGSPVTLGNTARRFRISAALLPKSIKANVYLNQFLQIASIIFLFYAGIVSMAMFVAFVKRDVNQMIDICKYIP
jgi:hypothetical protein